MAYLNIYPSTVEGTLTAPPSKSHTLRALYFALLAKGTSRIESPLFAQDTTHMIGAIESLGAKVEKDGNNLLVHSSGKLPKRVNPTIDAGNSGIVYRFITGLCALIPSESTITGDHSIRTKRPIMPLVKAINSLGGAASPSNAMGHAPIRVSGPIHGSRVEIDGSDSQPVSALIYAASQAPHPIEIAIDKMGEKPWIELSLSWLKQLNIPYEWTSETSIQLYGNASIEGFTYSVPGDFSSIAPFIALAVIQNRPLLIEGIDLEDSQGDKSLIPILEEMGARFKKGRNSLEILPHDGLQGIAIDMDQCIDLLPILAVIGSFASGETELYNAAIARKKECNRLESIAAELKKMGAEIELGFSSLKIKRAKLMGASDLYCYRDHRMAMALSVAALCASSPSQIEGYSCVAKTFPHFFSLISQLGGSLEYRPDGL